MLKKFWGNKEAVVTVSVKRPLQLSKIPSQPFRKFLRKELKDFRLTFAFEMRPLGLLSVRILSEVDWTERSSIVVSIAP